MVIKGALTEKEYVLSQFLYLRPKRIFSIIGAIIFLLFIATIIYTPSIYSLGVLAYLLGYFFIFIPWNARKIFRQYKAVSAPFSLEAQEEGLFFKRINAEALVPWDEILKWKRSETMLLLYPASNLYYVVAHTFFDNQSDFLEFQEELKKRVGKAI